MSCFSDRGTEGIRRHPGAAGAGTGGDTSYPGARVNSSRGTACAGQEC